ncbi:RdgB/HAM1 family non-canonical purine NTP pyrophosphatase [Oceanobacter sp. 4_MG-2023]|uniref:RdgB/HAM1 family non-canonical purine NTP pyrophosphatase n=1 Tax=Oceanobacter sp. 4_MG-2023 TaxID=3062623 RepID=UPI002732B847|nr:RdgB/HAM1 family non-canonical purine NTP pyrophosphatase [Oceanobacter sp. 4_MG-2023]MDP2547739.1 RdgB/HAM1 family non-canonical purine NTP pyrophosphatase [Oceanobacter sp. 4_MG-2023]
MKIVLASGNAGKLREFSQLFDSHFADRHITLIPQSDLGVSDADETGLSFVENAILKARHAATITGLPALADDSGLEVDALQGQPGIYSARFASMNQAGSGDHDNNHLLLQRLADVPAAQRTARFQCVLVYMRHGEDPTPQVFQGHWEGTILTSPSGSNGFGYDPLFYVAAEQCAAADLDKARKNALSHRGQAMRQLLQRWQP